MSIGISLILNVADRQIWELQSRLLLKRDTFMNIANKCNMIIKKYNYNLIQVGCKGKHDDKNISVCPLSFQLYIELKLLYMVNIQRIEDK